MVSSCELAQLVPLLIICIVLLVGVVLCLAWFVLVVMKNNDEEMSLERNVVSWSGEGNVGGASSSSFSLSNSSV
jgi:uncharacterized membrane protein YqiK